MAYDATGQEGLWKYDGTNASRVGSIILNSMDMNALLVYQGALYMGAATNGINFQPWKYDGTNFNLVAQINAFNTNASPVFWTTHRNAAYFMADDGLHGLQLWRYDGTNAARITDLAGGGGYWAFSFNDNLYFLGNDNISGFELWKYDGATISLVADVNPGITGALPRSLGTYRNTCFLSADDGLHGDELWRLDPLSEIFRITAITRLGSDISLTWTMPGGTTNVVELADGLGPAHNFRDCSQPIVAAGGGVVTTNYTHVGGATNTGSQFYRVRF